ncbi:MAG TPA: redoxin domain-containing protein [Polyangiaceae bacterium]|nr:redoxin domain-containing protein [Polyangiaceae bacterium]
MIYPRAPWAWLGVELIAREPSQPGVKVRSVFPRSPAARAGLEEGDVLLSLDGRVPVAPVDVSTLVQERAPGSSLGVLVERAGAQRLLRVDLEGMPEFEDRVRLAFIGRQAPEIAGVTTFQGETSALADVRGRVVVVEFWASWCGPCRFVSPTLDRWYRDYRPRGAEVIGITVDSPSEGAEVAQRLGMSYTLAHDPSGRTTRSYLANQVPMIVLIDRRGVVRDVMVGSSKERLDAFERALVGLLGESS